ncbi:MAG TPA: SDR family NAD(P)-dependent oxidoreductase, partial [Solirubrobacteraceae bacterium]|nr:SDR family NAD(P)-dependent oxidoreductase [Solirubrobacteraceae bacterium]
MLITGSTAGLGRRVAADLAASGWDVFIHGRDPARTQAVARETGAAGWHAADLSSLQEVRRLAEEVGPLDVLVNNAGVGAGTRRAPRRELSADGHELRLAVNFLAGFLLTRLLLERIAGRVVNVASIGQAPLDF